MISIGVEDESDRMIRGNGYFVDRFTDVCILAARSASA
jgi:hypothetical protein